MCLGDMEQALRWNPSFIYRQGTLLFKCTPSTPQLYPQCSSNAHQSNIHIGDISGCAVSMFVQSCFVAYIPVTVCTVEYMHQNSCASVFDWLRRPSSSLMSTNTHKHTYCIEGYSVIHTPSPLIYCPEHTHRHAHTQCFSGDSTWPLAMFLCKHLDASMIPSMTVPLRHSTHPHFPPLRLPPSARLPGWISQRTLVRV